jgi:hypothetical protein
MTVADRKPFSLRQVAWGISLFAVAAGLWLGLTLFLRSRAERLPPTSASRVAVAEEAPAAAPPTAVAPPAEVADAGSAPGPSSIEVESAKLVWGCRGDVDKAELVVLPEIGFDETMAFPAPAEACAVAIIDRPDPIGGPPPLCDSLVEQLSVQPLGVPEIPASQTATIWIEVPRYEDALYGVAFAASESEAQRGLLAYYEAKGRLGAPRPFEPDADPADPLTAAAEAERYLTPRSNDCGE